MKAELFETIRELHQSVKAFNTEFASVIRAEVAGGDDPKLYAELVELIGTVRSAAAVIEDGLRDAQA